MSDMKGKVAKQKDISINRIQLNDITIDIEMNDFVNKKRPNITLSMEKVESDRLEVLVS